MAENRMVLTAGQMYRARLLVLTGAMLGPDSAQVRSKLEQAGFQSVLVWTEEGSLPPDWPADRTGDMSEGEWDQVWVEGYWPGPGTTTAAAGSGWHVYDYWRAVESSNALQGQWQSPCSSDAYLAVQPDGRMSIIHRGEPVQASSPPKDATEQWREIIEYKASEWNLPATLVGAIVSAESGGDPNAVSSAGALGLMQLLRSSAKWLSDPAFPGTTAQWQTPPDTMVKDPTWNVHHGCRLLAYLLAQESGNIISTLARYNAGSVKCGTAQNCPPNPWNVVCGCYKPTGADYVTTVMLRSNGLLDSGWTNKRLAIPPQPGSLPASDEHVTFGGGGSAVFPIALGVLLVVSATLALAVPQKLAGWRSW